MKTNRSRTASHRTDAYMTEIVFNLVSKAAAAIYVIYVLLQLLAGEVIFAVLCLSLSIPLLIIQEWAWDILNDLKMRD